MDKVYFNVTPSEAGVLIVACANYINELRMKINALEFMLSEAKAGAADGEKAE